MRRSRFACPPHPQPLSHASGERGDKQCFCCLPSLNSGRGWGWGERSVIHNSRCLGIGQLRTRQAGSSAEERGVHLGTADAIHGVPTQELSLAGTRSIGYAYFSRRDKACLVRSKRTAQKRVPTSVVGWSNLRWAELQQHLQRAGLNAEIHLAPLIVFPIQLHLDHFARPGAFHGDRFATRGQHAGMGKMGRIVDATQRG